jgi:hypothetical protein
MIAGVVTGSAVLRHGLLIVRHFGLGVFGRCLVALLSRRRRTFLCLVAGPRA